MCEHVIRSLGWIKDFFTSQASITLFFFLTGICFQLFPQIVYLCPSAGMDAGRLPSELDSNPSDEKILLLRSFLSLKWWILLLGCRKLNLCSQMEKLAIVFFASAVVYIRTWVVLMCTWCAASITNHCNHIYVFSNCNSSVFLFFLYHRASFVHPDLLIFFPPSDVFPPQFTCVSFSLSHSRLWHYFVLKCTPFPPFTFCRELVWPHT